MPQCLKSVLENNESPESPYSYRAVGLVASTQVSLEAIGSASWDTHRVWQVRRVRLSCPSDILGGLDRKDGKVQKDAQSWIGWPESSFFSKSISKCHFSPDEIVKLTPLPAVYLFGGPLWNNVCSPSTALLILKQPGALVWLALLDDTSKSALVRQDLFASQGLCWIYKIYWVWEVWNWHDCCFLFCPAWENKQKHWHFSPLLACSEDDFASLAASTQPSFPP